MLAPVRPQARFDDLYSLVYKMIDDAKGDYQVLKLYKGSHGALNPHGIVTEFGKWFYENRRGVLAFAVNQVTPQFEQCAAQDLSKFDFTYHPTVPIGSAFDIIFEHRVNRHETQTHYLNWLTSRTHNLGAYRGGSSGYDDEAKGFASAYFRHIGIRGATPDRIVIFNGGAKSVFLSVCAAVMCERRFDDLFTTGGVVLAPAGYYQSLRLIPTLYGGTINVVPAITDEVVANWLTATSSTSGRVIYVPMINNMDGRVLDRRTAHEIAFAVSNHNSRNLNNPCFVIGDDVYAGSYLADDLEPWPIGGVSGFGQWCVSVVTPSKTVALPTARVAFACVANPVMRAAVEHYRTVLSHGRVPQAAELTGIAALCLTPREWISTWNGRYRVAVRYLTGHIEMINEELGEKIFDVQEPQGGWYAQLRIRRSLFGDSVTSGVDAQAVLLYYGGAQKDSGIALLAGELFGAPADDSWYYLRANLAVDQETLEHLVERLRAVAARMQKDQAETVGYALSRAHRVAPQLALTLKNARY